MHKRVITILIVLLILALAMYFVPCPRFIEFRSNCVEVDRQGNVLSDEGEIFLKGIYYHYLFQEDTFQLTDVGLPSVDVIKVADVSTGGSDILDAPRGYDFIWIPCGFLYTDPKGKPDNVDLEFATIFTRPDFPYLIFQYGDMNTEKYFVSTNTNAPSPVEMLKEFCLYQENYQTDTKHPTQTFLRWVFLYMISTLFLWKKLIFVKGSVSPLYKTVFWWYDSWDKI